MLRSTHATTLVCWIYQVRSSKLSKMVSSRAVVVERKSISRERVELITRNLEQIEVKKAMT